ncbi:hypothetical protein HDU92_004393 [Lobulomyces angularis]|nr:hypothetical protein HDU92_004393 [Lobulomyces angularis]
MTFLDSCISCSNSNTEKGVHPLNFDDNPIVPIAEFVTNATRNFCKVSHDGKFVAFLAKGQSKNKTLQVEIQPLHAYLQGSNEGHKVVVTHPTHDIRGFTWSQSTSNYILYWQDKNGNENMQLFRTNIHTLETICLTPFEDVKLGLVIDNFYIYQSKIKPNKCLVALNINDKSFFDIYHLDIESGEIEIYLKNPDKASLFYCNDNLDVQIYCKLAEDGSTEVYYNEISLGEWKNIIKVEATDTVSIVSLTSDGKSLIYRCSTNEACTVLLQYDFKSNSQQVLSRGSVDVASVKVNPKTNLVEAVCYDSGRRNWVILDKEVKADFDILVGLDEQADIEIYYQTKDNNFWVIQTFFGNKPTCYYLYERESKKLSKLFATHPNLEKYKFGKCESVNFIARDGLQLQGYFTYPSNFSPDLKYPMVLLVHGGPWSRDRYGFGLVAHWLANRGYVIFQPNFRGSTGFTKELLVKGYKQWGKTMQTDLMDAVDMAVSKNFIDRDYIAIFGGSYGGYAALAGVALTPEFFTCSVDIVGPSNIHTLLNSLPPYWEPEKRKFRVRIGDLEKESEMLKEVSPLYHAEKIVRPLLIGQGKNDPRVKTAESEQIVDAIEQNGGNVYYVLYPNEGHGFSSPVNRIDFYSKTELFLSKFMGPKTRIQQGLSLDVNVEGSSAIVKIIGKGF